MSRDNCKCSCHTVLGWSGCGSCGRTHDTNPKMGDITSSDLKRLEEKIDKLKRFTKKVQE